ncbi:21739_t:CDS:2 [Dentiscutata erythropus]|uniref:21739_t:CDS:1 n=1 Tax=Dentiscutata erythropus TaxID=1348616 RepID=A0A9N9AS30_9GLOM|nr:21739_t:CDS:2 [Dentiscutata erythropus]
MTFPITYLSYFRTSDYSLSNSAENYNFNNSLFSNNDNYVDSEDDINTSGHYKLLILITSKIEEYHHRRLLRRILFGIEDNLVPCMKYDTSIYYRFLIPPYNVNKKTYRSFVSESVEYNDIVEFQHLLHSNYTQETILDWTQSLKNSNISFDHAVLLDDYSIISLAKLKMALVSYNHSPTKLQNIVWSNFDDSSVDDMFVILGSKAISTILANKDLFYNTDNRNIATQAYFYNKNERQSLSNNWSDLFFVNDNKRFITFPSSLDYIPRDSTIAVRKLYSKHELLSVSKYLLISPVSACQQHIPSSIAIVTSSYFHDRLSNCTPPMLDVAYMTSENKRNYAQRHGYAFVPRSLEFQPYQSYNRKLKSRGRIEAVKKVLPHYEWVLWIDNDAIITNHEISIQNLFNRFYQLAISKKKKKHKASKTSAKNRTNENVSNTLNKRNDEKYYYDEGVSRPKKDTMLNAGVFLIRNSNWSFEFLKRVQTIKDMHNDKKTEQASMWKLLKKHPTLRDHTLLLRDDHIFNTFPDVWQKADFVLHYASDTCPAKFMLDYFKKNKD